MLTGATEYTLGERLSKQQTPSTHKEGKGQCQTSMEAEASSEILPPRTSLALGATFQPGELGLSLCAYLGVQSAANLNFVLYHEQNLITTSTKSAYVADFFLGDFVTNSAKADVSLHGHLKVSDKEVGHGVGPLANQETAEILKDSIQWRQATIHYIRKFGTSNKARPTFAEKVKLRTVHYNSLSLSRPTSGQSPRATCVVMWETGQTHAANHPRIVAACVDNRHHF
ncbi:hypothetical protein HPB50_021172 [Hyalomma asiaticum]|uniref:Uncharacterized protein n=1 Tax=Hyalomma asiaticum TaxID=266040 RepID=A0ACB7TEW9_HYAAI|nr:hypothetical protein HPB50_021172 [Hyalomma asiaticum]